MDIYPIANHDHFLLDHCTGLGCSSIYPAVMALPDTLGVVLSSASTSLMMIGGTFGELLLPAIIGLSLSHAGTSALPSVLLLLLLLITFLFIGSVAWAMQSRTPKMMNRLGEEE